ncbi:MAG: hypothetical protein ACKO0Z_06235, partial [Betaproteobacteria bacterium]
QDSNLRPLDHESLELTYCSTLLCKLSIVAPFSALDWYLSGIFTAHPSFFMCSSASRNAPGVGQCKTSSKPVAA